jgi:hypothetical protein
MTVEEAAAALRIGRTKAYAMARQWRATGGRSGLPVVDFGRVLRVPLCQLEALVGAPISKDDLLATPPNRDNESASATLNPESSMSPLTPTTASRRTRRHPHRDQLNLFGPDVPTS